MEHEPEASRIELLGKWREQELAEYEEFVDADGNIVEAKYIIDGLYEKFVEWGWPAVRDATGRLRVTKPYRH